MHQTETVTHRQWDNYARRIEKKNLREKGRSLTYSAIARRANDHILELLDDKTMLVTPGWREKMKQEEEQ